MIQLHRPLSRSLLISASTLALFVAGCNKKPAAAPPAYTPPPAAVKPTASLSADRTSINKGESVKLSWTTTDATNVSIAPEVGAVTPQGSTTVTPTESTTYTLTASSAGGNTDATVRISVNASCSRYRSSQTRLRRTLPQGSSRRLLRLRFRRDSSGCSRGSPENGRLPQGLSQHPRHH